MKSKINFPALVFCGLSTLGFFNCTSAPKNLEYKLDAEGKSQTYTLEFKIDNFFIGINPVKSSQDGSGGYLVEIDEEKSPDEYIKRIIEVDKIPIEIFDNIIKRKRMSDVNCYAAQVEVTTPEFYIIFNQSYDGKEKKFSKSWQVNGEYNKIPITIIDINGDGNVDSILYDNKAVQFWPDEKILKSGFKKSKPEKEKDVIYNGMILFEKAKKYFSENVGYF